MVTEVIPKWLWDQDNRTKMIQNIETLVYQIFPACEGNLSLEEGKQLVDAIACQGDLSKVSKVKAKFEVIVNEKSEAEGDEIDIQEMVLFFKFVGLGDTYERNYIRGIYRQLVKWSKLNFHVEVYRRKGRFYRITQSPKFFRYFSGF